MEALSGMEAALYLRKSRVEEGLDTQEVLDRHRRSLVSYAGEHGIHIIEVFPEVVSGESLFSRPQMLRLLEEVEAGRYDCVLCMDLDRLSRGRMKDQGIILDAFKDSNTLIVTPEKVYDLALEIDEEYAELKTFMARREYKIITKRLRRGLQQTIEDGGYIANAPYGYRKITVGRKPTLEVYEPEAHYVRLMFELYAQGMGCVSVARQVNAMGARPHRSAAFSRSSVAKILSNPTYIGKIVWNQKKHIRKGAKGNEKHITIYQPREKWTITDGIHPALIEKGLYDKVQDIMAGRYAPARNDGTVKSPLVGLIKCDNCGQNMQRMVMKQRPYLLCTKPGCCCAAQFPLVEERVLSYLSDILKALRVGSAPDLTDDGVSALEVALDALRKEYQRAERQKETLYELLETGVYDLPTFRSRMAAVQEKLSGLERRIQEAEEKLSASHRLDPGQTAQRIKAVLDAYAEADSPGRNALLKSVIQVIYYHKDKKTKPADFTLRVVLRTV